MRSHFHVNRKSKKATTLISKHCTLCEPLQTDDEVGLVPIYPMKFERRQAREELDSVNDIEQRTTNKSKRWFILVRRPQGGMGWLLSVSRLTCAQAFWQDYTNFLLYLMSLELQPHPKMLQI